jgi:hypothetical protein
MLSLSCVFHYQITLIHLKLFCSIWFLNSCYDNGYQHHTDIGDRSWFWLSCLSFLVALLLKLKLFGFPIFRFWANLMTVITETRCVHWCLRFYYFFINGFNTTILAWIIRLRQTNILTKFVLFRNDTVYWASKHVYWDDMKPILPIEMTLSIIVRDHLLSLPTTIATTFELLLCHLILPVKTVC